MAKMMIVDDHAAFRIFLGTHMTRLGFQVLEAIDGVDAMAKVDDFDPDVIVLDSMMPRKDGPTVLRELRGRPGTARIPIVILSARCKLDDKKLAFEAGADDYLVKPLVLDELSMRISRLLARAA
jgi:DNA-binding response OmpR family regulator